MKLAGRQIEAFLARPDPAAGTVLLYGADAGLVSERARLLAGRVVEDLDDPFRVSELVGDDLKDSPGRLVEEAQALCLMGGRRLVRVRQAGDLVTPAVRDLLALSDQAGFVLIEAGELGGSSKLRRMVEEARQAVAIPCYREEDRDLAQTVRAVLDARGFKVDPDAAEHLVAHLGGDRMLTRSELEKLALYLDDRTERRVSLADAAAVVGDSSALQLDDVINAAVLGDAPTMEQGFDRLLAEGEPPQRVLRMASLLLMRLLRLHLDAAGGRGLESVVKAARPPIFWKLQDSYLAALRRWEPAALTQGLALLQDAERRCRSGQPETAVCWAALTSLLRLPRPGRRR